MENRKEHFFGCVMILHRFSNILFISVKHSLKNTQKTTYGFDFLGLLSNSFICEGNLP